MPYKGIPQLYPLHCLVEVSVCPFGYAKPLQGRCQW